MFPLFVVIVPIHLSLEDQPLVIAVVYAGEPLHLIHDPIYQFLLYLWEIPISAIEQLFAVASTL